MSGAGAAFSTFFSTAAWSQGVVASLAAYLAYWAVLAKLAPPGRPATDMQSQETQAANRRLVQGIVVSILLTVFLLPWGAMAAAGAWRAGLTYFVPVMAQTVLNVTVEGRLQRANPPKTLAVYGSTAGNNLVRLGYSLAALWDMSLAAAVNGAGVHPALAFTAAVQAAVAVFTIAAVTAAAIFNLPVQPGTAEAKP